MVTSRRQIINDNDRYGGFIADTDVSSTADTGNEMEFSDDILRIASEPTAEKTDRYARTAVAEPEEDYTEVKPEPTRQASYKVETPASFRMVDEPVVEAPKKPRRVEDVMPEIIRQNPTATTTNAVISVEQPAPVVRERKLSAAAKRTLVIYMSVVVAIVAAIIATGVVVSGVAAEVAGYETSIAAMEETIRSQTGELGALSDEAVIRDRAEDMGMVDAGDNASSYDRLEIAEPTPDESGVFDAVRDWFNSIFGG